MNLSKIFISILLVYFLIIFITNKYTQLQLFPSQQQYLVEIEQRLNSTSSASTSTEESPPLSSTNIILNAIRDVNRPMVDEHLHGKNKDIDPSIAKNICSNFKCAGDKECLSYPYDDSDKDRRRKKRRIFAGGLIADDSWHAIGANALETFGIFHSIIFVESNRTQSFQPRKLRFVPGSQDYELLMSGIFGLDTPVYVHQFVYEHFEQPIIREHLMRDAILQKWKELGMTRDDVGLIMDVDEIPSRKVLRALQICDIFGHHWDSSFQQTCRSPLIRLSVPMFEGSPKCIHQGNDGVQFGRFLQPAFVIGACIQGIGDSKSHPVAQRTHKDKFGNPQSHRKKGYGFKFNYTEIDKMNQNKEIKNYPLYNAADFRQMVVDQLSFGYGFHFHNFFDLSLHKLRFKYAYYGHTHKHAFDAPLGAMNADMNLFVKCVHNISDDGNRKRRLENGLEILDKEYGLPIAMQLPEYIEKRHEELKALLEEDEREYGRADLFDGHHLYGVHMLTNPGKRHQAVGNKLDKKE